MPDRPADALIERLARGDIQAAGTLFDTYAPYLRALVRRQLSDQLRSKFDSTDVVQSVWVQVIRRLSQEGWSVEDEARLRALLATIARRRLLTRVRQLTPDVAAERSPAAEAEAVDDSRNERASEIVQAQELWDTMLELCPPEHHPVLMLRREGLPLTEIAARTGLHEGSVRRILRRLARELALRAEPLPPEPANDPDR
ncbi:MAG TPA: sigma-70 family RNA polymerase sigma factor [Gemmataceae bacterium]|jgi:RNA polymerase sigma-70 factor (ECF subfamily)|nr:sigma-70 family RNA polymerase sigma factor [Gemmataceae bacterium]